MSNIDCLNIIYGTQEAKQKIINREKLKILRGAR